MSVYKPRKSPFYHYDFQLDGHRFSGSTKAGSKRDAKLYEHHIARPAARAALDASRRAAAAPLTWGVARDRWWRDVGRHHGAGDSRENTERSLKWLDREIGRDTLLVAIDDGEVATLVARRRGDGVANATVNRSVTEPLRKVLRREADIWSSPVVKIRWSDHLLAEPDERVRELTGDEQAKLIDNVRPDYLPIFEFSLVSGVRLSGCLALRWSDIDWGARMIGVIGKGGKHYRLPLSRRMREILWPLRGYHDVAVFTYVAQRSRDGRTRGEIRPITRSGLKSEFRRARAAAGLPSTGEDLERGYRWHDNRHTAATRLLRAKGNLKLVQKLLGHRRIETTAKYAHATMEDLRDALDGTATPEKTTGPAMPEANPQYKTNA